MTDAHLFTGGRVFTGLRYARALLVDDGRVVAVGPEESVRPDSPTGTEHHDLAGRLLVPGLVDAHLHLTEVTRMRVGLDLTGVTSLERLRSVLADWAAAHPTGPIVGRGWDPERWAPSRWPDAGTLDRVVPDRPVVLYHASGHAAAVNSVALGEVGLNAAAPAPEDPSIGRSGDGRPSGILYEEAMRPLGEFARRASPVDAEALARTIAELIPTGLTSVGSIGTPGEEIAALRELDSARRLPLSVRAYIRLTDRMTASRSSPLAPTARFEVVGVKAFLDGAFGTRTAWLSAPYMDAPGTSGIPVGDEAALAQALGEAVDRGLAPALHAIGDQAVGRAIRLLGPLAGRTAAPARIEHASLTPPDRIAGMTGGGPMLVVQPGFVWSDHWLADRLGPERARWAYVFRTLRHRGIPLAGSSDAPFDPVDPWRGIRAAVRRRDPTGRSANPDPGEALSPEEALNLYTSGAAEALGLPERGRLEAGAPADFVVLRAPGLSEALLGSEVPVAETWVAGETAYRVERTAEP
ncbi:MAG: amidohydrolase [Thermoplasmata archaeon]